ncbi:MAG: microcystin degradation protein MlrC [Verrucomicrobiales bacterium]|nr:microcystin degradation protein MlrC [Verrucomicrobiales bacterium]
MSPARRVLFAGLFHETHTFVEGTTGLRDFAILRGEELLRCEGDSSPLGGALAEARTCGWTILPTVDFRASPSAMVEDEVIETFWKEFETGARRFLNQGVDAIYLVLHGAMTSQSLDDVEGEILTRIRQLPGATTIPIFGVFDLHANFTQRMAEHSNCLVAYRENPHTDARDAAQLAAKLLERSFQTRSVPRTFWIHPPLMWPPTGTGTAVEPMLSLENLARKIEQDSSDVWCANVVAGFSFADIPATGVSFTISTIGFEAEARKKLNQLSTLAGENRALGNATEPGIDCVMAQLLPLGPGLTVLVEPSDNIGGGAPGDGTGILRALVKYKVANAAVCINDPEAVAQLQALPIGNKIRIFIGGKGSDLDAGPLELEVKLVSRSNGRFELEDKKSHLASMSGNYFEMGPTAVARYEGILILLTSIKTPPFDLGQWRSQGIDPAQLSVIGVKAAVAHRRAYDSIAKQMFWVDTPGPCSSNLKNLPYKKVNRPIYPLDLS